MIETWRPMVGFEGLYEISDAGQVVTLRRGKRKTMALHVDACGYLRLTMKIGGRTINRRIYTLVAEAFIGPRPSPELVVRHLDGDPFHNTPDNLRYGTVEENAQDMIRHGRHRNARKTACARSGHMFTQRTMRIDLDGTRHCRPCRAEDERNRRARNKSERATR